MIPLDDVAEGELLVVRRVIEVPRERVFAAWLDPVGMPHWLSGGRITRATVELNARVGGAFRIVMRHDDADHGHRGVYLAIEPPSLLSFTWSSEGTQEPRTVVTIEFVEREHAVATEVVLTHRGLPPSLVEPYRRGWDELVGKLDAALTPKAPEACARLARGRWCLSPASGRSFSVGSNA